MLFSKILLAYDGSKASNQALERAIELAKVTPGSSLYVVHAFEFPGSSSGKLSRLCRHR